MSEVKVDGPGLLNVLNRLVNALDPSHSGDPVVGMTCGRSPKRWKDTDYFYVEANLAESSESDIDISIHGGLVFIRIVR
jgi:hypothetical protein